jgi:hypothetical protein
MPRTSSNTSTTLLCLCTTRVPTCRQSQSYCIANDLWGHHHECVGAQSAQLRLMLARAPVPAAQSTHRLHLWNSPSMPAPPLRTITPALSVYSVHPYIRPRFFLLSDFAAHRCKTSSWPSLPHQRFCPWRSAVIWGLFLTSHLQSMPSAYKFLLSFSALAQFARTTLRRELV